MKLKFTLNIYIYKSSTKIISFVDSIHTHFMNITSRLFSVNASKKYENNDNYSWIYHCKMGLNRHLFISKLKHILPLHFSLFIEKFSICLEIEIFGKSFQSDYTNLSLLHTIGLIRSLMFFQVFITLKIKWLKTR